MSLGVLGGTFDPIHVGHLGAAESVRGALGLRQVLLVPAGQPPHRAGPAAGGFDRFAMVALAAAGHDGLVPCDLELRREGISYTVDTLEQLRRDLGPEELVLILGSDALAELGTWRSVGRVRELARLACVERPGHATQAPPGLAIESVASPRHDVSSTRIRARLAAGEPADGQLPGAVAEYIAKRGLYR